MRIAIQDWAAWAPGLVSREQWIAWLNQPAQPVAIDGAALPALSEMPAMMRRRVNLLGRAALQTAYWCQAEASPCPVIFASRYGDIQQAAEMLRTLAQGQPLSPTAFSMSVHNAIGALYSIAREDTGNYTAVAAGQETIESAFIEATGLLADGAPAVMIVYYEASLPEIYANFAEGENFCHAWACRVVRAVTGGFSLACSMTVPASGDGLSLPADVAALEFLLSQRGSHEHVIGHRKWLWSRHVESA